LSSSLKNQFKLGKTLHLKTLIIKVLGKRGGWRREFKLKRNGLTIIPQVRRKIKAHQTKEILSSPKTKEYLTIQASLKPCLSEFSKIHKIANA